MAQHNIGEHFHIFALAKFERLGGHMFPIKRRICLGCGFQRDARATLQLIVDTLAATSGVNVKLGTIGLSSDPLQEATLTIGGGNVSARTLLLQALDSISSTSPHFRGIFVWNFLFDADTNAYWLRLRSATKTETNGRQIVQFIRHSRN